jgi:tRNA(His) guanylyltransferase
LTVSLRSPLGHINNLYNTAFWALVASGLSETEAEKRLAGTTAADKNNILFDQFAVNYNKEPDQYRRGSLALRLPSDCEGEGEAGTKKRGRTAVSIVHEDMVKEKFWVEHPDLLANRRK